MDSFVQRGKTELFWAQTDIPARLLDLLLCLLYFCFRVVLTIAVSTIHDIKSVKFKGGKIPVFAFKGGMMTF